MNKDDWFAADMAFIISNVQRELKEEKEAREREEAEWARYDEEIMAQINATTRRTAEPRPRVAPIVPLENCREWKVALPSSVFLVIFLGFLLSLLSVLGLLHSISEFCTGYPGTRSTAGFAIALCVIGLLVVWGFVIHFVVWDYFIPKHKMEEELKRRRMEQKQKLQESGAANAKNSCPE